MCSEASDQLQMLFFPFMAPGHMIPMVDMIKPFASCHGVKATILTTRANTALIQPAIDRAAVSGHHVDLLVLRLPSAEAGLPEGLENLSSIPLSDEHLRAKFTNAISMLEEPLRELLQHRRPAFDCIVSDTFFPWTADLGIPRLVFHGTCFFSLCVGIPATAPHGPAEPSFLVPHIPHRIELFRTQFPSEYNPGFAKLLEAVRESENRSYGVVVNSFYEMEPDYANHYRDVLGKKAWHIGPVSLCNKDESGKSGRGGGIKADHCASWLDSNKLRSVVYVCFGSLWNFSIDQMKEIAVALATSVHPFLWVVPDGAVEDEQYRNVEGLKEKIKEGKGLIVRVWAPQMLIHNHEAIGGFMTHCGWNSCLESICAGVPLITWPLFAEQFFNEKLIVDVLRVGVAVGNKKFAMRGEDADVIKGVVIKEAIDRVLMDDGDQEAIVGMRQRVAELGAMAKRAVEKNGSSWEDMGRLVAEMRSAKNKKM